MSDVTISANSDKLCGCLELTIWFTYFSQQIETVQGEEQGGSQQKPRHQVGDCERVCKPKLQLEEDKQDITFKDEESIESMRTEVAKMGPGGVYDRDG